MATPNIAQSDTVVDIATLLLPLAERLLILPSSCIAEIMRLRELEALEEVPDWLFGSLNWRRMKIPVISFEAINQDPAPSSGSGSRIVLINAVRDAGDLPYIGMITQGVPHLLRLTPADIHSLEGEELGPAELQKIVVFGQSVSIPNLDFIQAQLREVGGFETELESASADQ